MSIQVEHGRPAPGARGTSTSAGAAGAAGAGASCTPLAGEPIGEEAAADLARVFKALADPVRLRLVSLIGARRGGEVCVCELTPAFDLTQPTISHHLKVLREAGILGCERRGTWVFYWLVPAALERVAAVLAVPAAPVTVPGTPPGPAVASRR